MTDRKAGQMARVGAIIKRKVVMHKTEHSISVVVISNPTNLSGMVGYLGTSKHVKDLAAQDQGNDLKELSMVGRGGQRKKPIRSTKRLKLKE